MKTLCEKEEYARQNGHDRWFTVDNLWQQLSRFNQLLVSPLAVDYFQRLHYIERRHSDARIRITDTGRRHCRDPDANFTLPENYQPREHQNVSTAYRG